MLYFHHESFKHQTTITLSENKDSWIEDEEHRLNQGFNASITVNTELSPSTKKGNGKLC